MFEGRSAVLKYKNLLYTIEYNDKKSTHLSKKGCMKFLEREYDDICNNMPKFRYNGTTGGTHPSV